jgi:PTS system ascorbate-specific IIC component
MIKVLTVCGNGMGTSLIIKNKVTKFLCDNAVEASVDSCSLGEANSRLAGVDVILCSKHLTDQLRPGKGQQVLPLTNLLNPKEYGEELLRICQQLQSA